MARMRTIGQVTEYFKKIDPESAISGWWLRTMVKSGKLKHHRAGSKYLIDLDALEEFLANPPEEKDEAVCEYGKIRKVQA